MTTSDGPSFEQALASALRAIDPLAALAELRGFPSLSAELRELASAIDPDGFRLTALIVARLRLERLIHGSPFAATWSDADPARFTAAFRRYHAEVPPAARFPTDEATCFEAWIDGCLVLEPGATTDLRRVTCATAG